MNKCEVEKKLEFERLLQLTAATADYLGSDLSRFVVEPKFCDAVSVLLLACSDEEDNDDYKQRRMDDLRIFSGRKEKVYSSSIRLDKPEVSSSTEHTFLSKHLRLAASAQQKKLLFKSETSKNFRNIILFLRAISQQSINSSPPNVLEQKCCACSSARSFSDGSSQNPSLLPLVVCYVADYILTCFLNNGQFSQSKLRCNNSRTNHTSKFLYDSSPSKKSCAQLKDVENMKFGLKVLSALLISKENESDDQLLSFTSVLHHIFLLYQSLFEHSDIFLSCSLDCEEINNPLLIMGNGIDGTNEKERDDEIVCLSKEFEQESNKKKSSSSNADQSVCFKYWPFHVPPAKSPFVLSPFQNQRLDRIFDPHYFISCEYVHFVLKVVNCFIFIVEQFEKNCSTSHFCAASDAKHAKNLMCCDGTSSSSASSSLSSSSLLSIQIHQLTFCSTSGNENTATIASFDELMPFSFECLQELFSLLITSGTSFSSDVDSSIICKLNNDICVLFSHLLKHSPNSKKIIITFICNTLNFVDSLPLVLRRDLQSDQSGNSALSASSSTALKPSLSFGRTREIEFLQSNSLFNHVSIQKQSIKMAHRGLYNPNTLCFVNSVIIQLFMHLQFRYSIIAFPLDEEGCDGWNSYDSVYDDLVSGAELHDCDDKEAIFSQQKESSPTSSRFIDNKENHIHKGPQIQMTCDECHLNFNETHHYYHKHFLREKHEKWERLAAKKSQNAINQYHNEILELQNLFLRMEFDQSEEHLDALQFLKHFRMDTGADIKPGVEYDSNEFLVTLLSHISMYLIRKQSPNFVFRLFQISLQNQIVCNNVHINSSYEENLVLNISIENSSFLSEAIAQTLLGAKIQFPCPLCAEQRAVATKACSSSSSSSSASTSSSTIPSQGASYSAQNGFSIANALNSAITRTALVTLPNTLIIRLKRQSFDPLHGKVYSNSYLSFPYRYDELLDLTPFMADVREQSEEGLCGNDIFSLQQSHLENGGASFLKSFSGKKSRCFAEGSLKYRLVGIVNYCGSGETGHYWSLVRKEGAEKSWIVFNDEYVKEVDESLIPSMCFGASGQQRQFQKLSRYGGFSKLSSSDPFEKEFMEISENSVAYLLFYERIEPENDWEDEERFINQLLQNGKLKECRGKNKRYLSLKKDRNEQLADGSLNQKEDFMKEELFLKQRNDDVSLMNKILSNLPFPLSFRFIHQTHQIPSKEVLHQLIPLKALYRLCLTTPKENILYANLLIAYMTKKKQYDDKNFALLSLTAGLLNEEKNDSFCQKHESEGIIQDNDEIEGFEERNEINLLREKAKVHPSESTTKFLTGFERRNATNKETGGENLLAAQNMFPTIVQDWLYRILDIEQAVTGLSFILVFHLLFEQLISDSNLPPNDNNENESMEESVKSYTFEQRNEKSTLLSQSLSPSLSPSLTFYQFHELLFVSCRVLCSIIPRGKSFSNNSSSPKKENRFFFSSLPQSISYESYFVYLSVKLIPLLSYAPSVCHALLTLFISQMSNNEQRATLLIPKVLAQLNQDMDCKVIHKAQAVPSCTKRDKYSDYDKSLETPFEREIILPENSSMPPQKLPTPSSSICSLIFYAPNKRVQFYFLKFLFAVINGASKNIECPFSASLSSKPSQNKKSSSTNQNECESSSNIQKFKPNSFICSELMAFFTHILDCFHFVSASSPSLFLVFSFFKTLCLSNNYIATCVMASSFIQQTCSLIGRSEYFNRKESEKEKSNINLLNHIKHEEGLFPVLHMFSSLCLSSKEIKEEIKHETIIISVEAMIACISHSHAPTVAKALKCCGCSHKCCYPSLLNTFVSTLKEITCQNELKIDELLLPGDPSFNVVTSKDVIQALLREQDDFLNVSLFCSLLVTSEVLCSQDKIIDVPKFCKTMSISSSSEKTEHSAFSASSSSASKQSNHSMSITIFEHYPVASILISVLFDLSLHSSNTQVKENSYRMIIELCCLSINPSANSPQQVFPTLFSRFLDKIINFYDSDFLRNEKSTENSSSFSETIRDLSFYGCPLLKLVQEKLETDFSSLPLLFSDATIESIPNFLLLKTKSKMTSKLVEGIVSIIASLDIVDNNEKVLSLCEEKTLKVDSRSNETERKYSFNSQETDSFNDSHESSTQQYGEWILNINPSLSSSSLTFLCSGNNKGKSIDSIPLPTLKNNKSLSDAFDEKEPCNVETFSKYLSSIATIEDFEQKESELFKEYHFNSIRTKKSPICNKPSPTESRVNVRNEVLLLFFKKYVDVISQRLFIPKKVFYNSTILPPAKIISLSPTFKDLQISPHNMPSFFTSFQYIVRSLSTTSFQTLVYSLDEKFFASYFDIITLFSFAQDVSWLDCVATMLSVLCEIVSKGQATISCVSSTVFELHKHNHWEVIRKAIAHQQHHWHFLQTFRHFSCNKNALSYFYLLIIMLIQYDHSLVSYLIVSGVLSEFYEPIFTIMDELEPSELSTVSINKKSIAQFFIEFVTLVAYQEQTECFTHPNSMQSSSESLSLSNIRCGSTSDTSLYLLNCWIILSSLVNSANKCKVSHCTFRNILTLCFYPSLFVIPSNLMNFESNFTKYSDLPDLSQNESFSSSSRKKCLNDEFLQTLSSWFYPEILYKEDSHWLMKGASKQSPQKESRFFLFLCSLFILEEDEIFQLHFFDVVNIILKNMRKDIFIPLFNESEEGSSVSEKPSVEGEKMQSSPQMVCAWVLSATTLQLLSNLIVVICNLVINSKEAEVQANFCNLLNHFNEMLRFFKASSQLEKLDNLKDSLANLYVVMKEVENESIAHMLNELLH